MGLGGNLSRKYWAAGLRESGGNFEIIFNWARKFNHLFHYHENLKSYKGGSPDSTVLEPLAPLAIYVMFGLFEKNLPHGFDKSAD